MVLGREMREPQALGIRCFVRGLEKRRGHRSPDRGEHFVCTRERHDAREFGLHAPNTSPRLPTRLASTTRELGSESSPQLDVRRRSTYVYVRRVGGHMSSTDEMFHAQFPAM